MKVSSWSIKHPVPPIALFLILMVMGMVSFLRLPVTELPNVDLPIVSVTVTLPNAAPDEMVSRVIQPIESEVSDIAGLQHVEATGSDGSATITLTFRTGTPTDRALSDVKDAVTAARGTMPATIEEPLVEKLDFTGHPVLTYAVRDPSCSAEDLSQFIDKTVIRALQATPDVGSVKRFGGAVPEVIVDLDLDRLLAFGLTVTDVNAQLAAANLELGNGSGALGGQEFALRATGEAHTLEDLGATPILLTSGDTVALSDLGSIRLGSNDPTSFALHDGAPVVAVGIYRATGASDLSAAENARARIAALRSEYPGVSFDEIDDATIYTAANYEAALSTLMEGAVLAMIVVFLFLRDWRATLVALAALPLSVVPTFIIMDMLGFSLNMLSLLGITLVTGILVDDAIVEIENIVRHIQRGRKPFDAAMEAADEIGLTVVAISLTIVAVFAPVGFMGGFAGAFFSQFGLTVAFSVIFSLLVARLITPMMAAHFLKAGSTHAEPEDGWVMRRYLALLRWTLRQRFLTLSAGLAIFVASIFSATLLPQEFVPPTDTGRALVSIELPPGSRLLQARAVAQQVTTLLKTIPEVKSVFVDGTSAMQISAQVNYGDKQDRARSWREIDAEIDQKLSVLPDLRTFVLTENGTRDITINVQGDTEEIALLAARNLAAQMKRLPELENVSSAANLARPEIVIRLKPELAARYGITAGTAAAALATATAGTAEADMPKFRMGEDRLSVRLRLDETARNDLSRFETIKVEAKDGTMVPLGLVANAEVTSGSATVKRYDRAYVVAVEADLAPGVALGPATEAIYALPAASTDMPKGSALQPSGDVETMNEIFSSFGLAMGAGIMLVYVVLVLLFNSFITPVTIMLSLPLAIGGAIFALYLYGAGIGLSVIIGLLMLMGIVTKNAIMLVEFAQETIRRGATRADAILDAAQKRARPIVMTTIAMTAGMVPSTLAHATGGEFRAPMAVAVIGGLILSTGLSLLFVPSLFSVIEGGKDQLRRLRQWRPGGLLRLVRGKTSAARVV